MSLAQVTRGELSRTALHLVETGKSRPSLATLRLIAERTGKPLDFFLTPQQSAQVMPNTPLIHELELAVAQSRFEDAKRAAKHLLETSTEPAERGRICLLGAQAFLQSASVDGALPLLAEARSIGESTGDKRILAEFFDWQAAADHLMELPSALIVAHQALALAESLEPKSDRLVVRIHGRIGAISVAQHRWREAIDSYQRAVDAGSGLLDFNRLAKMYNDLSIAYRRIGDLTRATEFAHKAISVHEMLNDALSIGRAETNLALILLRQGDTDEAAGRLDHALSLFATADQTRGLSHVLLAQAELLIRTGDLSSARLKAAEAAKLANELREDATVSEAKQVLATVAELEGNPNESDRWFAESIDLLEQMKLQERLTTVRSAYADALEHRGDIAGALAQWRLAVAAMHPEAVTPLTSLEGKQQNNDAKKRPA
jgi:tetratricopeptide (TPR) repeat protein